MEPFEILGADPDNPLTHVLIVVRQKTYSAAQGLEQPTADEVAMNHGAA